LKCLETNLIARKQCFQVVPALTLPLLSQTSVESSRSPKICDYRPHYTYRVTLPSRSTIQAFKVVLELTYSR